MKPRTVRQIPNEELARWGFVEVENFGGERARLERGVVRIVRTTSALLIGRVDLWSKGFSWSVAFDVGAPAVLFWSVLLHLEFDEEGDGA